MVDKDRDLAGLAGLSGPGSAHRALRAIERFSLTLETPIDRWVRRPQFNPLYHTGTITALLLVVIIVTGVYLMMFYQFGFTDSYVAVSRIEQSAVGRIMRALHRYASDLALITALLHGWRIFFSDRFRGSRQRRWLTGVLMATFVWVAGVTGYWLVADERAQVLDQTLVRLLGGFSAGVVFLSRFLTTEAAGAGWEFLLLMFLVHVGLTLTLAFFFWRHVRRLSRPRLMPPRYFVAGLIVVLTLAAVIVPSGMLPPRDPARIPGAVAIDPLFLFYLPAALGASPLLWWIIASAVVIAAASLPWLLRSRRRAPVIVSAERCTGCTLCEPDCPYGAITMASRPGGGPPPLLAQVDPARCVSCGICIGACLPTALSFETTTPDEMWRQALAMATNDGPVALVFTCERHARLGAARYLKEANDATQPGAARVRVFPLSCAGMANPNLVAEALEAGAAAVHIIGCPPEDCLNREGNARQQERIERKRPPRLRPSVPASAVMTDWLSPVDFGRALRNPGARGVATAQGYRVTRSEWRSLLAALALIAVVVMGVILLGRLRYEPLDADHAVLALTIEYTAGSAVEATGQTGAPQPLLADAAREASAVGRVVAMIDGRPVLEEPYSGSPGKVRALLQAPTEPGAHRVTVADVPDGRSPVTLYEATMPLDQGQIVALHLKDARIGADPEAGRRLFYETNVSANAGCRICHSLEPGVTLVGPSLAGVATRAETAVPDLDAEGYLRQSLLAPDAHVVDGFPAGQMLPDLGKHLSSEQLDDLVAFLLTLR